MHADAAQFAGLQFFESDPDQAFNRLRVERQFAMQHAPRDGDGQFEKIPFGVRANARTKRRKSRQALAKLVENRLQLGFACSCPTFFPSAKPR